MSYHDGHFSKNENCDAKIIIPTNIELYQNVKIIAK